MGQIVDSKMIERTSNNFLRVIRILIKVMEKGAWKKSQLILLTWDLVKCVFPCDTRGLTLR